MLARVAEGSSHAAAAGIKVDNGRAGDLREKSFRGIQQSHRFLMAVAVEQNALRPGLQLEIEIGREFFEEHAGGSDGAGSDLLLAAQKCGTVVLQSRKAARLQK